ncbi:secretory pathway Sec39 [Viridothelium virens]|uniref:Secretory pathway Sec39 n=1 Tax=Viridothelium virens TaxID=1048519 RepID=A0A6A6H0C5_VIRVR|nr:secretory pathway Sec39 [Viridothelium virens]
MSGLSKAHYTLLAVRFASESNIQALTSHVAALQDALSADLLLRIVLTYLPESVEPPNYIPLIQILAGISQPFANKRTSFDISAVKDLSDSQASKHVRKLHLLPLKHPEYPPDGPSDRISQFVYHRAHRIEEEAGLLALVPQLVSPFLDHSKFLRTWLISSVLPLLRIGYEYYPQSTSTPSLQSFENLDRADGVNVLMSKAARTKDEAALGKEEGGTAGRDLRGVVAPWMVGDSVRKRRKLDPEARRPSIPIVERTRRLSVDIPIQEQNEDKHGWEYAFQWLVDTAAKNLTLVTEAIEDWDGPGDADFGGYDDGKPYLVESVETQLSKSYGQAAMASIYVAEANTPETIEGAHRILVRLAGLFNFTAPPSLTTNVEMLPRPDRLPSALSNIPQSTLQTNSLLRDGHPLTTLNAETYVLLQMFVYSAFQLARLGSSISIVNVVKLRFYTTDDEQLSMFRRIMHGLTSGSRKDEHQWDTVRSTLIWLWGWGIDPEGVEQAVGVFGMIQRDIIERELLRAFISSSCYDLAIRTFLTQSSSGSPLSRDEVEAVIIASVLNSYDNASNGNRTRGGMKKAHDILAAFRPHFVGSSALKCMDALLAATHALSFYSLTLQHGVPFQPVNIRVSNDPISLIEKVLQQNPRSYTKLDDLIFIAQNFVEAGLTEDRDSEGIGYPKDLTLLDLPQKKAEAESRVVGMAIDASLAEDDFETAYSYIANRFQPPDPSKPSSLSATTDSEKTAWRSAVAAGKYRSSSLTTPAAILRRLDQRMDLLSRALLLAPPSALPEILNAWRRVEEEMAAQLAREDEAEHAWNDRGDRVQSGQSPLPGTFVDARTVGMELGQPTREVGRLGGGRGGGEAPMGLFDVARGAAAAFNRTAFPLREPGAGREPVDALSPRLAESDLGSPTAGSDEGRVRKRDVAYNAATGALASGLGWVLGAKPFDQQQERTPSGG